MHRIQSKSEKLMEQDLMEFYFATGVGVSTWNLLARAFYLSVKGNFFFIFFLWNARGFNPSCTMGGGGWDDLP